MLLNSRRLRAIAFLADAVELPDFVFLLADEGVVELYELPSGLAWNAWDKIRRHRAFHAEM